MIRGSGRLTAMCYEILKRMKVKLMFRKNLSNTSQDQQRRGSKTNALTFRCMNFCRGSYHRSRTSPEGTAAQRNVLSVYGLRACVKKIKINKKKSFKHKTGLDSRVLNRELQLMSLPTLHFRQPLVSGIFSDTANFL